MKLTPMMKQYYSFKEQYPGKLLLFRMGDFYEMFNEDAEKAAKILNITLTSRDKGKDPTPMAGFPHHALEQYLPKIIDSGNSAVVVDQMEDPKQAKGIVKRGVTRVVTPGTLDGELADDSKNTYLMALNVDSKVLGVAIFDLSTGEFKTTEMPYTHNRVDSLVAAYAPSEILLTEGEKNIGIQSVPIQFIEKYIADSSEREAIITKFYDVKNLESLGLADLGPAIGAVAMVLSFVLDTQKMEPEHIERPSHYKPSGEMVLDRATIMNLDLVINSQTNQIKGSLFGALDQTKTPMGRRLLHSWILNPLLELDQLEKRQFIVEALFGNSQLLSEIQSHLKNVSDINRIIGKIGLNRVNGRDLKALQTSLENIEAIVELINEDSLAEEIGIAKCFKGDNGLGDLAKLIDQAIDDSPPTTITEGGIIKNGYNKEVDEIRNTAGNSKDWVKEFAAKEKKETGIPSLKIGFNKVFGYYIEVTKTHQDKVPEHYIRKQTLVNSERYITEELKKKEEIILGAEDKLAILEYEIFQEIRERLLEYLDNAKLVGKQIARLDVLASFAQVARERGYCKPKLEAIGEGNGILKIEEGRHPVVELLSNEDFIANDIDLTVSKSRFSIITGPNMSGKSTYIRQVAVLVLMAQMGSYIPAKSAHISMADRVFSRVGASDDLSQGRSTFMVEMEEAANIINNSTENSLVILDEVGRGTSTYDGVSIAWALSEHIIQKVKARTLFATHYHELLQLGDEFPNEVINYNVHVKEENDEVIFLRKIVKGGTDRSYGIYVAKLAGLPNPIINKANNILSQLETERGTPIENKSPKEIGPAKNPTGQISFFGGGSNPELENFKSKISEIDTENITPIEALNELNKLVKEAKKF